MPSTSSCTGNGQSRKAAARKILRESRAHAVTTRAIADVSGVRVGSIYQYFGKKEDMFFDLYNIRSKE